MSTLTGPKIVVCVVSKSYTPKLKYHLCELLFFKGVVAFLYFMLLWNQIVHVNNWNLRLL